VHIVHAIHSISVRFALPLAIVIDKLMIWVIERSVKLVRKLDII